ncbi:hypothetical protein BKA70DRAFT_1558715 [Coprinopsis sp. MPI-PUGE-AT-0042]|nr:hypothetical protein BKA70DRAFT_1558715 [Coprinopsis sp. MPI-PUGE-AT-0042]
MEELPLEIWFLVTELFSDEDLYNIIGVNRFFFNLGMDRKYSTFRIEGPNSTVFKQLDHISDPSIAQRIKALTVSLYVITAPVSEQVAGGHTSAFSTLRQAVTKTMSRIRSQGTPTMATPSPGRTQAPSMINRLMDVLPLLVNVDEFRIMTWALPSTENLDEFYQLAWSVLGKNLRCLSISATLDGYRKLSKCQPSFPALRHLEVAFANVPGDAGSSFGESPAEVAPLINSVASQLEVLKIRSFSTLDLSLLFLNLEPLPCLESTLIRIPFNHGFVEDASGFKTFLTRSSSTLKNVDIRLPPTGLALAPMAEDGLYQFLSDCLADPLCFSKVQCMDIYPTNLAGGVEVLRRAIKNASLHLTEFTVRDRYLKIEEVFELFDALARDAPGLRRLWLSVGEAAPGSTAIETLAAVRNGMRTRSYPDWKLWDLTIFQGGNELDNDTMHACARSIPSVKSFWGQGYTTDFECSLTR